MSNEDHAGTKEIVFTLGCGVILGMLLTILLVGSGLKERERALKAGAGRWVLVNPATGASEFQYIPCPPAEKEKAK